MTSLEQLLFGSSDTRSIKAPLGKFCRARCEIDQDFSYAGDNEYSVKYLEKSQYGHIDLRTQDLTKIPPRKLRRLLQEWLLLVLPCHFFNLDYVEASELDLDPDTHEIDLCHYVWAWMGERMETWLGHVRMSVPSKKWLGTERGADGELNLLNKVKLGKGEYTIARCWFREILNNGLLDAISSDLPRGTKDGWRFIYSLQVAGECIGHALMTAQSIIAPQIDPELMNDRRHMLDAYMADAFKQWYAFLDAVVIEWGSNDQLDEAMRASNICPSLTSKLSMSSACGNFMTWICASCDAKCQRTRSKKRNNHTRCSGESVCKATDIKNLKEYKPQHVEGCNCKHNQEENYGPNIDEVKRLIDRGDIPLLELDEDSRMIRVVPFKKKSMFQKKTDYVAITHVWSDGCGNENENTLPPCQIARLARIAKGMPVWMDTLCIPSRSENMYYRKKAIAAMDRIYYQAAQVKLICNDLDALHGSDFLRQDRRIHDGLAMIAVSISAWTGRLWTLQEAVFAGANLEHPLPDGGNLNINFETMLIPDNECYLQNFIEHNLADILTVEKESNSINTKGVSTIFKVMSELRFRKTTQKSDEAIVVANILGIATDSLVDAKGNPTQQMQMFYSKMSTFPIDVLFCEVDRLNVRGLRWAPSTFSIPDWSTESPAGYAHRQPEGGWADQKAVVTSSGLKVFCPNMRFSSSSPILKETFTLRCVNEDQRLQVQIRSVAAGGSLNTARWQNGSGNNFVILLNRFEPKTCICLPEEYGFGALAVIDASSIMTGSKKITRVHFVSSVVVVEDNVAVSLGWESSQKLSCTWDGWSDFLVD